MSRPQGHIAAEWIKSLKNPNDPIENQTRDQLTSSALPNVSTYGRKTQNTSHSIRHALYSYTYNKFRVAQISGGQVDRTTKCLSVAPNICGSSVRNLLHVTLLASKTLRGLEGFLKMCVHLDKANPPFWEFQQLGLMLSWSRRR
jgi:hypothetical protein